MTARLRDAAGASATLAASFAAVRAELHIAGPFPADVEEAARAAAARGPAPAERADRTAIPFVTIDPPGSLDLDQALHLEEHDGGLRVHYAIADIGAFVDRGGPVELEAWQRGVTAYGPDFKTPGLPAGAVRGRRQPAPDGPRPAFLFTADLDRTGEIAAFAVERAMVESRRRMSYAGGAARGDAAPAPARQLREERASARGATRLDLPAQEIVEDRRNPCGFRLHWEERLPIEDWNAHVSLLVGMGAAKQMLEHGIGLLRVMDAPDPERLRAAQTAAATLHGVAALTALRHAMSRAQYAFFDGAPPAQPEHYALAAPYAHVTAPMRRLCDRYVLELLADGPDAFLRDALGRLPATMARADARAGPARARADRRHRGGRPPAPHRRAVPRRRAGVGRARRADPDRRAAGDRPPRRRRPPGAHLEVELTGADPATRAITFAKFR